jgi:hypothetical protein
MGIFIKLKTNETRPREIALPITERRLLYLWGLIDCYLQNKGEEIVPPAVKMLDEGKYVTVDGHHRLLIADLFYGESKVYVPEHKMDVFTTEMIPGVCEFARKDLNSTIERIFDIADKIFHVHRGTSYSDIRQTEEFYFLKDIESARKFHADYRHKIKS